MKTQTQMDQNPPKNPKTGIDFEDSESKIEVIARDIIRLKANEKEQLLTLLRKETSCR